MNGRLICNMIAIIAAASFAGVMLFIGLMLGAYWQSLPPAAFLDWFSTNSHLIARTIPLVAMPALLGVVLSLRLDWQEPTRRRLWAGALAALLGIAIITFAYHLPMNARFDARAVPLDQVTDLLDQWLAWHALRVALGLVAAALGVIAASSPAGRLAAPAVG